MKAIGDSTDPAALAKQIAFALSGAAANARALRPALLELPASRLKELAEHACRLGELKSDAYLRGVHVERLAKEVVAALGAGTGPGQPAELAGPAYVAPKATQQLSPPPTPVVPVITVAPFPPVQPPPALGPAAGSAQPEASARAPSVDTIAGTIADDDPLPDVPADDTKKARPVVLKLDTGATEAVQQDEGSAKKRRRTSKKPAETAVKIEEPKKEPLPIPIGDRLMKDVIGSRWRSGQLQLEIMWHPTWHALPSILARDPAAQAQVDAFTARRPRRKERGFALWDPEEEEAAGLGAQMEAVEVWKVARLLEAKEDEYLVLWCNSWEVYEPKYPTRTEPPGAKIDKVLGASWDDGIFYIEVQWQRLMLRHSALHAVLHAPESAIADLHARRAAGVTEEPAWIGKARKLTVLGKDAAAGVAAEMLGEFEVVLRNSWEAFEPGAIRTVG